MRDRFCMEWPCPQSVCRRDNCFMVHDARLVHAEFGGALPPLPVTHCFNDQRDEDCRHPMLMQRPVGRANLFMAVCFEFPNCAFGGWCKFLHIGRKTPASLNMDSLAIGGLTFAEARRQHRKAEEDALRLIGPPPDAQAQAHSQVQAQHHLRGGGSAGGSAAGGDVADEIARAVNEAAVSADLEQHQITLQALVHDRLIAAGSSTGAAQMALSALAADPEVRGIASQMHALRSHEKGLAHTFLEALNKMHFVRRQGTLVALEQEVAAPPAAEWEVAAPAEAQDWICTQ
jgi:hypothetical protein